MSKQITTIPPRQNRSDKRLKVAAYCRVSTEHEEHKHKWNLFLKQKFCYFLIDFSIIL